MALFVTLTNAFEFDLFGKQCFLKDHATPIMLPKGTRLSIPYNFGIARGSSFEKLDDSKPGKIRQTKTQRSLLKTPEKYYSIFPKENDYYMIIPKETIIIERNYKNKVVPSEKDPNILVEIVVNNDIEKLLENDIEVCIAVNTMVILPADYSLLAEDASHMFMTSKPTPIVISCDPTTRQTIFVV